MNVFGKNQQSYRESLSPRIAKSAFGAAIGGLIGAALVVGITQELKAVLDLVSNQPSWALIVVPLVGLSLSVLVLYGFGLSATEQTLKGVFPRFCSRWRVFAPGVTRSDLTGDMVTCAGEEERFPWRLAPIRILAINATVGLGAPMGTEAPAAYLGLAAGVAVGDCVRIWRKILRSAAVGGSAAGVAVLMGIPLVGTAYILELGRRHHAPLSVERVTAALVGGFLGWFMKVILDVNLFRLVVPKEPPHSMTQAVITAVVIGTLAGSITSITGTLIYRAKAWKAHPVFRLAMGGLVLAVAAVSLSIIATPSAAIGPGGGAIRWIEEHANTPPFIVLSVALLHAVATIAAAAAGGCGGLFVPFLAVGDLAGRVFAPIFQVPSDLAGAAGAASGISGGYRLPFTAIALALGQGGPHAATLTCLATVIVAGLVGERAALLLDRTIPIHQKKEK